MDNAFSLLTVVAFVALFAVGVGFYALGDEFSALLGVGAVLVAYMGLARLLAREDVGA